MDNQPQPSAAQTMQQKHDITISPFTLSIPERDLSDLQSRLSSTRWPSPATAPGWTQGPPLTEIQELTTYWQHQYNWRKCETWFNSHPQFTANIMDEQIHFLHIKSAHKTAIPMLLVHGWPGSVLEFHKVIDPLTKPSTPSDAFHLVIPSLVGYGWSSKPSQPGWGVKKMSQAFTILMEALGYDKWVAQGGDWGADLVSILASENPPASLVAVHMNTAFFDATKEIRNGKPANAAEELALKKKTEFTTDGFGYFLEQSTRPQTIAYSLADSPVGQLSWMYEKIYSWAQQPMDLTKDEILDNVMVYWLSNSGGSSAQLYWENSDNTALPIKIPVGVSVFMEDQDYAPRSWGERYYEKIVHWREIENGGHFAAWEVPELFVREVRETFRHVR